jgi:hypothetical protein
MLFRNQPLYHSLDGHRPARLDQSYSVNNGTLTANVETVEGSFQAASIIWRRDDIHALPIFEGTAVYLEAATYSKSGQITCIYSEGVKRGKNLTFAPKGNSIPNIGENARKFLGLNDHLDVLIDAIISSQDSADPTSRL